MALPVVGAIGGLFVGGGIGGAAIGAGVGLIASRATRRRGGGSTHSTTSSEVGRISGDIKAQGAGYGQPIARVYGSVRVAGNIIWYGGAKESFESRVSNNRSGGGRFTHRQTHTEKHYKYTASFAVAIAAGEIENEIKIWASGKSVTSKIKYRLYTGSEDQMPDPLIKKHCKECPAYRGLAYVVFENIDVTGHGGRLPDMVFEVKKK